MKLAARIAFAVSLAVNAVGLCLLSPTSPGGGAPLVPVSARESQPVDSVATGSDVGAYREALLGRGLTFEETKPLVLAWLLTESARAGRSHDSDEYWRSAYAVAAVEKVRQSAVATDRLRAELIALYGSQASRDPVFAPLFMPLDDRYAFLQSEKQLALQKLQLDRQLKQARSTLPKPAPATLDTSTSARESATAEAWQELRAGLGAEAALDYLYRFSPLADQLRSAKIDLTDAEFRGAFATLLQFETSAADPQTFARTREALRTALGDERFTQLWAARDPLFGVIAGAARQQGLAEGAIVAAYAVFNDAQDRLAAAADRFAAVDPPRAAAELRGVQQDMQQRLASLVGQDAADALMRASAHFAISMRQTSSTNLRE